MTEDSKTKPKFFPGGTPAGTKNVEEEKEEVKEGGGSSGATLERYTPKPSSVENTKTSKATKRLLSQYNLCESQRQMHRLSYDHLRFLDFWTNTFILTIITMVSGLMAFIASSNLDLSINKEVLSAIVGSFSVLSVAIQKFAKIANFGSRADMHGQVAIGMKRLCDEIESDITENPNEVAGSTDNSQSDEGAKKGIQTYREMYHMCLDSCNSTIPLKIQQAFSHADKRFSLNFLSGNQNNAETTMILYGVMCNELYCEFSRPSTWLCILPDPETTYKRAFNKVKKLYKERNNFFDDTTTTQEDDSTNVACCC